MRLGALPRLLPQCKEDHLSASIAPAKCAAPARSARTADLPASRKRTATQAQRAVRSPAKTKTIEPEAEPGAEVAVAAPSVPKPTSFETSSGQASPLGPSKQGSAVNFSLVAPNAKTITLCLFDEEGKALKELPVASKTGETWHVAVDGLPLSGITYGYKVSGDGGWDTGFRWDASRVLLDPYAPLVAGRRFFGKRDEYEKYEGKAGSQFLGTYELDAEPFDWGASYQRPNIHLKDSLVYEMPVRGFTTDASSGVPEEHRGTFLGVADKVDYIKKLGITAVELLPVFEYDELEFQRAKNPRDHMVNMWGYSHINFFAPMSRFATNGGGPRAAAREFKEMVKTMHSQGIEVWIDVVYNHTAESDDRDPYMISFRGIDSPLYYMTDKSQYTQLINWSGCGNTVNANHPVVTKMIIDSLVQWSEEYHVDGFRFDLASCLCRDSLGRPLPVPPLIEQIAKHPILSKRKVIAEPWDLGMYQVGKFPSWEVWGEWNGMFRDVVRKFIKGDAGLRGDFATRICGSADLYNNNGRKPYHGINFIIAHDGFSLYDQVAYNGKHNEANGEGNNDGTNDNFSWNCGAEGPTDNAGINALRQRQMRNMLLALMVAQGTPMIVMGDEVAKTHGGNNNWYGHEQLGSLQWALDESREGLLRFCQELFNFRRAHPLLGRDSFLGNGDITFHVDNWSDFESRFISFTLHDRGQGCGSLFAAFNAHPFLIHHHLPAPPQGQKWCRLVDTNLPSPKDFTPGGNRGVDSVYGIEAYSSILLIARDANTAAA